MELWQAVIVGLVMLAIVAGGYVYIYFHIIRTDPRELEFREHLGQDDRLFPPKDEESKDIESKDKK